MRRLPILLTVSFVTIGLIAALFAPSLKWLIRSWLENPYYSHGLLVPLAAIWLVWRSRAAFALGDPSDAGLALIGGGLLVQLFAVRRDLHPLSLLALILIGLGVALLFRGRGAFRAAIFPAAVLALAVPLPWVERLAPPLAGTVAAAAARAAATMGVGVTQAGAQLSTADGAFQVGAPCSGLRSVMALVTLAVVFAGVADGPVSRRAALVLLAIPAALVANWVRLTGLLWLTTAIGPRTTMAVYHPLSSPLLFLGAATVLAAAGGAMGCRLHRGP